MPDDFNLFDDDDLIPDDLRDEGDQASENDSDDTPQPDDEARPAWTILPGDTPPAPAAPDAAPPWDALPGEEPPPPGTPPAPAPWDATEDGPRSGPFDAADDDTSEPPEAAPADLEWLLEEEDAPAAEAAPGTGEDFAALEDDLFGDADAAADAGPAAEPADLGWLFEGELEDDTASPAMQPPAGEPAPDAEPIDLEAELFDETEPATSEATEGTAPLDWLLEEDDDLTAAPGAEAEAPDETEAEPEQLPDWLLAGYASEEEARAAEESAAESGAEDADVPEWLKPAAESVARGDDLVFDFDDDERTPAGTGKLPDWLAVQAAAGDDDPGRDTPAGDDRAAGAEGEASDEAGDDEALPDWLAADIPADDAPDDADVPQDDEPAGDDEALPGWLAQAEIETEDEDEAEAEPSAIRRILDDEARVPVWVYNPDVEPPDEIPDDMTYEEWEAYHEAREQALQQPQEPEPLAPDAPDLPEPPMPDLPEMAGAPGETIPAAPEDDADIPDWVRDIDFDADPLTQPFTSAIPEPADPETPGELPDWMTGAGDAETDWAALFGAPPAGEDDAGDAAIRRLDAQGEGDRPGVIPDWLDEDLESGLDAETQADLFGSEAAMENEPADMDWLFEDDEEPDAAQDDHAPEPPERDTPDTEEPAAEPAPEIPAWLADARPDAAADATPDDEATERPDLDAVFADMDAFGAEEAEPEAESAESGWLFEDGDADLLPEAEDADLPELDEVFPDLDTLGTDEPLEEPEPYIPEWLAEIERAERVEGPEEIPFPELELDDAHAPEPEPERAAAGEDDRADGDFVERFDPLEPAEFDAAGPPAEAGTEPEAAPMPGADDMPDWLREAAAQEPDADDIAWPPDLPPEGEREVAAVTGEGEPDWLQEISPDDVAAEDMPSPAEMVEPFAAEEAPAAAEEEGDAALEAAPLDSSALDDLLGATPAPAEVGAQEADDLDALFSELPDDLDAAETAFDSDDLWPGTDELAADAIPETAPPADEDVSAAPPAGKEPEKRGIFGLFRGRGKDEAAEPAAAPDAGTETPEPEPLLVAEPQPDWVEDLRPSELPVKVQAGGAEMDVRQKKVAELPARLRAFRERAMSSITSPETLEPSDTGPLAGITGALPAADAVLPADVTLETVSGLVVTPEQQKRAEHLQRLLDTVVEEEEEHGIEPDVFTGPSLGLLEPTDTKERREAAPEPEPQPARRRTRRRPDRWLVALVLLAALIGPFATDALHIADDPPALSGHRREFAAAIDAAVSEGDYVLFAFEYGPPAAGELDTLADALLRDILARGAIPLTLSTNPAGALHAETVVVELAGDTALLDARDQDEDALLRGEDYVVLGYLPGNVVGVRALRASGDYRYQTHTVFDYDLRGERTDLPVMTLAEDIALVIVIGDESGDVRTWAEQLEGVDVPKVALVAAAVEPLTTPYMHESAFAGYLAGVRDAYSFNAARNADARTPYTMPGNAPDLPNPETSRWQSMALGVLAAVALIGVGLFINLLRGLLRRRHR